MEDDQQRDGYLGAVIRIQERLKELERRIARVEQEYIHRNQFTPVERIVYGMAAAILLGVVGALLKLVVGAP